ncbi:hypothetical protein GCM10010363_61010 [Streptomyces omiyaensis]|uniref:hypothetical protein n=1 Tax=Streptomyces omiyaensis TaxID=68247 RepID=UPI001678BC6A|nr:hypothetical protein [Streptomyces omiyaensis]GGY71464.1 hypothetical protein GCM10010363_61010 [Streptomyces omiyaensis]
MSSTDALAAHLEWHPFTHGPDCAKPAWEIDQQTVFDKRRSRRSGPEHSCPNEDCGHRDHYDRIAVRVLCRSCGTVHLISGEEHRVETTSTVRTGYGQPPKRVAGLWLYPGPPLLDLRGYDSPGAYLCSRTKADRLAEEDIVGFISEGRGKRGATVWHAGVGPDFRPPARGLSGYGYATWAKNSGEKPFTSVTAAAKWVAAELDAAAAEQSDGTAGEEG